MDDIVLTFTAPADPVSMNDGDSWRTRSDTAAWRDRAYFAWCEQHPGRGPGSRSYGGPGEVHTALTFTLQRRRDPINFARTVKHIVDGFVLAGAWPDDTIDHVVQHVPILRVGNEPLVIVRVTPHVPHLDSMTDLT